MWCCSLISYYHLRSYLLQWGCTAVCDTAPISNYREGRLVLIQIDTHEVDYSELLILILQDLLYSLLAV